jgi:hypothetical protein
VRLWEQRLELVISHLVMPQPEAKALPAKRLIVKPFLLPALYSHLDRCQDLVPTFCMPGTECHRGPSAANDAGSELGIQFAFKPM